MNHGNNVNLHRVVILQVPLLRNCNLSLIVSAACHRLCQRRNEERKALSWSERCVDVFNNLEIIGEGTYGLVYKAKDTTSGKLLDHKICG
jgi:serine/threonine protein kinase